MPSASKNADERGRLRAVAYCLAAAALFGSSAPAAKRLSATLPPLTLAGLLYLGAAAAAFPSAARGGLPILARTRRTFGRLAVAVIAGGIVAPALLMLAVVRAPAGSVSLWLTLETVATSVLATLFFREHLDRRAWFAGGLVCVASAVLVSAPDAAGVGFAVLFVALAAIGWGVDNNVTATLDTLTPSQ